MMLNRKTLEMFHGAALEILAKRGVKVESPKILKLLGENGAELDHSRQMAKLPAALVEKAVQLQRGNKSTRADSGHYGCYEPYYYDWLTHTKRRATPEDLLNMIKLGECLDEIKVISSPLTTSEIDKRIEPIESAALTLKHTRKKFGGAEALYAEQIPFLVELGAVMVGEPYCKDFVIGAEFLTSPLIFGEENAERLLEKIKHKVDIVIGTMAISGITAPASLAGTIVVGLAELLAGWTLAKIIDPQACVGSITCTGILDMATGKACFNTPESVWQDAGIIQAVKELYGGEIHCTGFGRHAPVPGLQASYEGTFRSYAFGSLLGEYPAQYGVIDGGVTFAPTQLMLDLEINKELELVTADYEINAQDLCLDDILEVGAGPKATHLETAYTLANFKNNFWMPRLMPRAAYPSDAEALRHDLEICQRADQRWRAALATYVKPELDSAKQAALDKVLKNARDHLLR